MLSEVVLAKSSFYTAIHWDLSDSYCFSSFFFCIVFRLTLSFFFYKGRRGCLGSSRLTALVPVVWKFWKIFFFTAFCTMSTLLTFVAYSKEVSLLCLLHILLDFCCFFFFFFSVRSSNILFVLFVFLVADWTWTTVIRLHSSVSVWLLSWFIFFDRMCLHVSFMTVWRNG